MKLMDEMKDQKKLFWRIKNGSPVVLRKHYDGTIMFVVYIANHGLLLATTTPSSEE